MRDQYSTGGVSVLISDLLSENDFKVICLNPRIDKMLFRCKTVTIIKV